MISYGPHLSGTIASQHCATLSYTTTPALHTAAAYLAAQSGDDIHKELLAPVSIKCVRSWWTPVPNGVASGIHHSTCCSIPATGENITTSPMEEPDQEQPRGTSCLPCSVFFMIRYTVHTNYSFGAPPLWYR